LQILNTSGHVRNTAPSNVEAAGFLFNFFDRSSEIKCSGNMRQSCETTGFNNACGQQSHKTNWLQALDKQTSFTVSIN
jgi:hypothetical protein